MSDAATGVAPARFLMSLDQLHVLEAHAGITVPAEFHTEWSGSASAEERDTREANALNDLEVLGFLSPIADGSADGIEDRINPAVRAYLGLFADPALEISVRSWGGGRTYVHSAAVLSGYACSLVRTQRLDDRGQNPRNEDSIELSAFTFSELIGELLRSLREIDSGRPAPTVPNGSIVLPLTDLQGLINAIRADRPEVVEGALREVALDAVSLPIARAASFGIDAGFTLFARSRATGDHFSSHWFRADSGWFELALSTPPLDSVTSSIEFVDRSRVRLSTRGSEAIIATIITAIGTLGGALHG